MTNIPVLTTERLTLREISINDAKDIYYYASNYEVARFTAWNQHKSIEDTIDFINFSTDKYKTGNYYDWGIILNEKNKLIGSCGILNYAKGIHHADTGYVISKDYWNKGIATEAVKRIIEFAFNELHLVGIKALCRLENLASEKVMQKVGMSYKKTLKKYLFKNNTYHDMKLYEIVNEKK